MSIGRFEVAPDEVRNIAPGLLQIADNLDGLKARVYRSTAGTGAGAVGPSTARALEQFTSDWTAGLFGLAAAVRAHAVLAKWSAGAYESADGRR